MTAIIAMTTIAEKDQRGAQIRQILRRERNHCMKQHGAPEQAGTQQQETGGDVHADREADGSDAFFIQRVTLCPPFDKLRLDKLRQFVRAAA